MDEYNKLRFEIERSILKKEEVRDRKQKELFDQVEKNAEVTKDLHDGMLIRLKLDLGIGLSNQDYELLTKYDE